MSQRSHEETLSPTFRFRKYQTTTSSCTTDRNMNNVNENSSLLFQTPSKIPVLVRKPQEEKKEQILENIYTREQNNNSNIDDDEEYSNDDPTRGVPFQYEDDDDDLGVSSKTIPKAYELIQSRCPSHSDSKLNSSVFVPSSQSNNGNGFKEMTRKMSQNLKPEMEEPAKITERKTSPCCAANFPNCPLGSSSTRTPADFKTLPSKTRKAEAFSLETLHESSHRGSSTSTLCLAHKEKLHDQSDDPPSNRKFPNVPNRKFPTVENVSDDSFNEVNTCAAESGPEIENPAIKRIKNFQPLSSQDKEFKHNENDFTKLPSSHSHGLPAIPEGQAMENFGTTPNEELLTEDDRIPTFQQLDPLPGTCSDGVSPKESVKYMIVGPPAPLEAKIRASTVSRQPQNTRRPRGRTYENLFYQKKALNEKGPSAYRSASREQALAPYVPQQAPAPVVQHVPHQRPPHITKIVTELITEWEEEEESSCTRKKENKALNSNNKTTTNTNRPLTAKAKGKEGSTALILRSRSPTPTANRTGSNQSSKSSKKATPTPTKKISSTTKKTPGNKDKQGHNPDVAPKVDIANGREESLNVSCSTASSSRSHTIPFSCKSRSRTSSGKSVRLTVPNTDDEECIEEDAECNDNMSTPAEALSSILKSANSRSSSCGRVSSLRNSPLGPQSRSGSRGRVLSKILEIVLPGHGDPKLERVSKECSDTENFLMEMEDMTACPTCFPGSKECQRCKRLKKLLEQSVLTVRYLTELLVSKDKECKDESTNTSERMSAATLNPLLVKLMNDNSRNVSTTASTSITTAAGAGPRGKVENTTTSTIPKFNLDEFIRKFFRHILFLEDYTNQKQSEPFQYIHLFRAAIAARDCMAKSVMHKLKYGYHELKRRYEVLLIKKSEANEPIDENILHVLDSYRRFVRFIYYWWKLSLNDVEYFEQQYIPLERRTSTSHSHPMKYSKETTMVIDGVKYDGVFIPIEAISTEN